MTARSLLIYLEYFTESLCVCVCNMHEIFLPGHIKQVIIWGIEICQIHFTEWDGFSIMWLSLETIIVPFIILQFFILCRSIIYICIFPPYGSRLIKSGIAVALCFPLSIFQCFYSFCTALYRSFKLILFSSSCYDLLTLLKVPLSVCT